MKKEEAIELLEDLYGAIEDNQGRDYDEAFRMAIEALQGAEINCVHCPRYYEIEDDTGVYGHCEGDNGE